MRFKVILTLFSALFLVGCATTTKSMSKKSLSKGASQIFEANYDQVVTVAKESIEETGYKITEDKQVDDKTHMLIGNEVVRSNTWGGFVRLVIEKESENKTAVSSFSKERFFYFHHLLFKPNRSKPILEKMGSKLK